MKKSIFSLLLLTSLFMVTACGDSAQRSGENLGNKSTVEEFEKNVQSMDELPEKAYARVVSEGYIKIESSVTDTVNATLDSAFSVDTEGKFFDQEGQYAAVQQLVTQFTVDYLETIETYYKQYIPEPTIEYYTNSDGGVACAYYGNYKGKVAGGADAEYSINCEYVWNNYGFLVYAYEHNVTKASAGDITVSATSDTRLKITYTVVTE